MDAQRRAAARIRSVIKDVREVVDARSTARRLRLFRQTRQQRGALGLWSPGSVGPLEEELELVREEFKAQGRTDEEVDAAIELCLRDCLK